MKPVLVLQHQTPEHLAYLGTFLKSRCITYEVYNAEIHREFPSSIESYSALAVMGGSMSVNDPLYTNRQAEILILQAMYRDKPVIGHCLGGQLMAKALGARVRSAEIPEIGWQSISYVNDEKTYQWFGDDPTDTVIHWHYDTFEIPTGAKLIASSPSCVNQAFSIDKHLAMQFHIEMDIEKVKNWVSVDDPAWQEGRNKFTSVQDKFEILGGIEKYLEKHQRTADNIYRNWLRTTEWAEHSII